MDTNSKINIDTSVVTTTQTISIPVATHKLPPKQYNETRNTSTRNTAPRISNNKRRGNSNRNATTHMKVEIRPEVQQAVQSPFANDDFANLSDSLSIINQTKPKRNLPTKTIKLVIVGNESDKSNKSDKSDKSDKSPLKPLIDIHNEGNINYSGNHNVNHTNNRGGSNRNGNRNGNHTNNRGGNHNGNRSIPIQSSLTQAYLDLDLLVMNMRKYSESNASPEDQLNFLRALCHPYNLKIHYEPTVLKSPVNKLVASTLSRSIIGTDTNTDTNCVSEHNSSTGRVVINNNRNFSDFTQKIVAECNGVVLDSAGWNILVRPPLAFNPDVRFADIKRNFNKYTVFPVQDGTTINYYFYQGKWRISTANAYEINSTKWIGSKTYEEIIAEVFAKYPDFVPTIGVSYTIGFSHPAFHPLGKEISAWLIATSGNDNNTTVLLPEQKPIKSPVFSDMISNNEKALSSMIAGENTHYGYILRAQWSECGAVSNILLESSLLKKIRQLVYNLPHQGLAEHTREVYFTLRAYLNIHTRSLFIKLFPQYEQFYTVCEELIKKIVDRIMQVGRNKNILLDTTQIDTLAAAFIEILNKDAGITYNNQDDRSIVYDFIVDPRHTDLYFKTFV